MKFHHIAAELGQQVTSVYAPMTSAVAVGMSIDAPEQFHKRLDAVFGAIDSIGRPSDQLDASTHWSLARQQVFRAGKGEADSSEGEDEEEFGQQSEHLIDTLLDAEDGNVQTDQQGNIVQPSLAFCQALDNEQEYDEIDAVAGTTLRDITDPAAMKPNRFTEVLDDNVYEMRMRCHESAGPSTVALMDVDTQCPSRQVALSRGSIADQGSHGRPPLTGRRSGHGHSRSYVPHHVKHPEKYTCYILDEPLVVGGGDRTAESCSGKSEQEKAARAASSIAAQQQMQEQNSREPLPAFGSGIEFRPTKKTKQQGPSQGPQKSAMLPELSLNDDMDADGGSNVVAVQPVSKPELGTASCSAMDDDFGEGARAAASKPRRRQYRVRSDVTGS